MGVWGIGLFENDLALDLRMEFECEITKGKNVEDASIEVITLRR